MHVFIVFDAFMHSLMCLMHAFINIHAFIYTCIYMHLSIIYLCIYFCMHGAGVLGGF